MGFAHFRKSPKQICDSYFSENILKQKWDSHFAEKKTHKQSGIRTFPKKKTPKEVVSHNHMQRHVRVTGAHVCFSFWDIQGDV